jgi:hypothetical protein
MAREIPEVVRAAAGLAATVLDEARKLPETLPGLPVRVIGLAMQQAMRIQQQYAGFVARGDELFTGLRGEDEPGLATFDDDLDDTFDDAAPTSGYRESAFDRADVPFAEAHLTQDHHDDTDNDAATTPAAAPAAEEPDREQAAKAARPPKPAKAGGKAPRKPRTAAAISDVEVSALPADPEADTVVAAVEDVAEQVEGAQQTLDALPGEAPSTEEVLEELAIEEMVGDAPLVGTVGTDTATPADIAALEDSAALEAVLLTPDADATAAEPDLTADVATTADVLTPDAQVATVEATVTDEGVAAPETPTDGAEAGGSELSGSQAAVTAPVDGYDSFTIAQLRGRMRGYALVTVADLLAYEDATRAREPYLRMLRNRLEKLESQAVASSPLAPRGA